ncbi:16S rRNA (cytidine(1402)-2'-O)-methyltransferase [Taylorella equigenitalis]|uniref:16S rRNA (cytidine(1402)-2'-O)-methyltransferase n=1 Tax=Taylorella equigenitalis TaxID=29575 RepID=UPI00237C9AE9|nr:16S rRNA (cytidine(1402)-2'-O)-methyltransferase [Taylorella equigenitalis]WDU53579.1 16S rRNA (cytidine(1402)-2'-O)-methyltransferase [Taylorella equigenitalis]
MSKPVGQFCPPQMLDNLNHQTWPQPALYVVSTPIGNLADISYRAVFALQLCDVIACEDTRTAKLLLNQLQIEYKQLVALHKFNESESVGHIANLLDEEKRVALISDAGSPAISDPGSVLVEQLIGRGYRVIPVPGASAVIAAVMASGVRPRLGELNGFVFLGFLPPKSGERRAFIVGELEHCQRPAVLFEAPHRIVDAIADLRTVLGDIRTVTICRELTKKFESIYTGSLEEVSDWINGDSNNQKGEFVLIVHPSEVVEGDEVDTQKLLSLLLKKGVSLKDSVSIVQEYALKSKKEIYDLALKIKEDLSN